MYEYVSKPTAKALVSCRQLALKAGDREVVCACWRVMPDTEVIARVARRAPKPYPHFVQGAWRRGMMLLARVRGDAEHPQTRGWMPC